jgi:hypothetical protein
VADERVFAATPLSTAAGRVIASPFQFVLTGEDTLRVLSSNSLAGIRLRIQGRWLNAEGKVDVFGFDHVPNSDRTIRSDEFAIGVGAILNAVVYVSVGSPVVGQTFVILQLTRGRGAAAVVLGTLLQGYVTTYSALAWPGSPIQSSLEGGGYPRRIQGTLPAAGGEQSEVVPAGARWELRTWRARLTTSAVVGNRLPSLVITGGGVQIAWIGWPTNLGASNSYLYFMSQGIVASGAVGWAQDNVALPQGMILSAGDFIQTTTSGLAGGDQYEAPLYTVTEWLEVN